MKTKQTTKHALWASVTAIALCMAMLVGTTFAWFTDTASTAVNKIQSGTLKIGLQMSTDGKTWTDANGKTLNFLRKDGETLVEDANILWEPGCTYQLPQLRVINKGNLAVKFTFKVTGIEGSSAKLMKALEWNISELPEDGYFHLGAAQSETEFTASASISISAHMKEDAGNEYQNETITGIGITVLAVQDTVEYDSNGKTYDQNADSTPDNPNWETNTSASGTVSDDGATLKDNEAAPTVTVKVPAGAVAENTALTLTKKLTDNGSITVGSGENATTYEVKLTDASGDVTAASGFFTVDLMIGKNLVVTKFLHAGEEMTLAASKDAVADGKYYYDVTTGYVTFGTTHFSPFTAVYKFSGGLGTEEAPYLIGTEKDWNAIADNKGENVYFKQIADLSVSSPVVSFAGTYDGGNHKLTTTFHSVTANFGYLFLRQAGHVAFRNIHIVMDTAAIALLKEADWETAYGADFENLAFSTSNDILSVNANNFGFVVIEALYTLGNGTPVYNFRNNTNNVSLQNEGTCTGVFIGSGPCFNVQTEMNYVNCVNNGSLVGSSSVGFLYGNSAYIASVAETNSTITVTNCKNNATMHAPQYAAFAPNYEDLNVSYQATVGGTYSTENVLKDAQVTLVQSGANPQFALKNVSSAYRYELKLNLGAIYTTKDNHTWTADDAKVAGTTAWDTVWNVSNGTKFDCTVVVDANVADALNPFWAYDQRSATESGTFTSEELSALAFNDQGYTILAKAGKNYVIFITDSASYINGSISPMIYAYDSNGLIAGVKTVK